MMISNTFTTHLKRIAQVSILMLVSANTMASDDGGFFSNVFGEKGYQPSGPGQETYQSECSACHIAYPAPLLTQAKWSGIMASLDDHFGDNAEVDAKTHGVIKTYLIANAADTNGEGSRLSKFARRGGNTDSLRITDLEGFKRKHHDVDKTRMVTNNPDVGSFSQCSACHGKDAQNGIFEEDTVKIPNFAHWD